MKIALVLCIGVVLIAIWCNLNQSNNNNKTETILLNEAEPLISHNEWIEWMKQAPFATSLNSISSSVTTCFDVSRVNISVSALGNGKLYPFSVLKVPILTEDKNKNCFTIRWVILKAVKPSQYKYQVYNWESEATKYETEFGFLGRSSDWPLYQGAGDIWGFHLARLLGIRKLPAVLRNLTDDEVCNIAISLESAQLWDSNTRKEYCTEKIVQYDRLRYCSVQPYISKKNLQLEEVEYNNAGPSSLVRAAPSFEEMAYLRISEPLQHSIRASHRLIDISTAILFDFILDDHDRNIVENWLWFDGSYLGHYGHDSRLIFHDSGGLLFSGPVPPQLEKFEELSAGILCGKHPTGYTHEEIIWNDFRDNNFYRRKECKKICRFDPELVKRLESLHEQDMMKSMKSITENQGGFPSLEATCNWGVWQHSLSKRKFSFRNCSAIFDAVLWRFKYLQEHIAECQRKHGDQIFLRVGN